MYVLLNTWQIPLSWLFATYLTVHNATISIHPRNLTWNIWNSKNGGLGRCASFSSWGPFLSYPNFINTSHRSPTFSVTQLRFLEKPRPQCSLVLSHVIVILGWPEHLLLFILPESNQNHHHHHHHHHQPPESILFPRYPLKRSGLNGVFPPARRVSNMLVHWSNHKWHPSMILVLFIEQILHHSGFNNWNTVNNRIFYRINWCRSFSSIKRMFQQKCKPPETSRMTKQRNNLEYMILNNWTSYRSLQFNLFVGSFNAKDSTTWWRFKLNT